MDPFYIYGLTLIQALISNYTHHFVWDESTYLFPDLNAATVAVWERTSNVIPHITEHGITYPY